MIEIMRAQIIWLLVCKLGPPHVRRTVCALLLNELTPCMRLLNYHVL